MWMTGISISADSRIAPRAKSEKIRKPDQNGRSFEFLTDVKPLWWS
jgi:hypothetical protein